MRNLVLPLLLRLESYLISCRLPFLLVLPRAKMSGSYVGSGYHFLSTPNHLWTWVLEDQDIHIHACLCDILDCVSGEERGGHREGVITITNRMSLVALLS